MNNYDRIKVPVGLRKDLSDMIDSMDAAEKIISSGKSPARRIMTYVMSAAASVVVLLGIWTAVETFRAPKDTFTDPEMAYAEVEKALVSISEKMGSGLSRAEAAGRSIEEQGARVAELYYNCNGYN